MNGSVRCPRCDSTVGVLDLRYRPTGGNPTGCFRCQSTADPNVVRATTFSVPPLSHPAVGGSALAPAWLVALLLTMVFVVSMSVLWWIS